MRGGLEAGGGDRFRFELHHFNVPAFRPSYSAAVRPATPPAADDHVLPFDACELLRHHRAPGPSHRVACTIRNDTAPDQGVYCPPVLRYELAVRPPHTIIVPPRKTAVCP
jgi:hypothetical protein